MEFLSSLADERGVAVALGVGALVVGIASVWVFVGARRARRHWQATARRNQAIVDASGEGIFELDHDGRVRYVNPAAVRMLGYSAEELIGIDYRHVVIIDEATSEQAPRPTRYTTDMRRGVGAALKRKDGRLRPIEYRLVPLSDGDRSIGTLMTFADISERVRLDMMLADMQRTAKVGAWEYLPDNDRLIWTDEVYRIHDFPVGSSLDMRRVRACYDPADQDVYGRKWAEALEHGHDFDAEMKLTTATGRTLWVQVIGKAERFEGHTRRFYGTIQDITERRTAERKLRETRDFFAQTLDAMPAVVTYVNVDGIVTYCNRRAAEWWRLTREQIVGRPLHDLLRGEALQADARADFDAHARAALAGEPQSFAAAITIHQRRGDWHVHYVPERAADGTVRGFFAVLQDLTELKQLEARLVQAQKMEVVGQLAGGIAHDFNNLLGVVIGNLQLLERALQDHPAHLRKVATAMRAAVRGADLTRRLLSFSRQQILEPELVDLNRTLKGLDDLLRRSLGDSIEICLVPSADLWLTRVDPSQLENAILNLAINARDAMPHGGRLTIVTRNRTVDRASRHLHGELEPGDYVCVEVTDTGAGIDRDILKNVFEPFFTTKAPGKGSGLGLAMVHGFAKHAGGTVLINSELGRGTRVEIYLPRCKEGSVRHEETAIDRSLPGGSESILIVEDDADLRETSVATLANLGYHVIQAHNADAALDILSGPQRVDVLFTDVMMPGGMLGPTLAQRARELRPGLAVLFTTGYANTGAFPAGAGFSYADIVLKPYRAEDLALRIRSLLDREVRVA